MSTDCTLIRVAIKNDEFHRVFGYFTTKEFGMCILSHLIRLQAESKWARKDLGARIPISHIVFNKSLDFSFVIDSYEPTEAGVLDLSSSTKIEFIVIGKDPHTTQYIPKSRPISEDKISTPIPIHSEPLKKISSDESTTENESLNPVTHPLTAPVFDSPY